MIEEKLKEILALQLGIKVDDISSDSNILTDLGADSLDTVELIMDIEHTFKIEIDENDEENCHTVDSLVKMIEDKQNGNT